MYLISLTNDNNHAELKENFEELCILFKSSNLKAYRNKLLAHNDLKAIQGVRAAKPEVTTETLKVLLERCWSLFGKIEYALEGSVFVGGAAIQWLRDELQIIEHSKDSEYFATQVPDNGGVYFVPAFVGLGTPYWDMYARGTIVGLTRGSNKNHIIRATLEAIAYESKDVLTAMLEDSKTALTTLKVDGGASVNNFLMQFQADILGKVVERPNTIETTALGVAYLAGLAIGLWKDKNEIKEHWILERSFASSMEKEERDLIYSKWKKAVKRSLEWNLD